MQATPNTTVTVLNADSIDPYSGQRVNEVETVTGVPAHLVERPATRPRTGAQGRAVEDPATDTPRTLRVFSLRVPLGTPINRNSRVRDEFTLRVFSVNSVREHVRTHAHADLIGELTAVDPSDP